MKHLDLFSGIGGFALAAEQVWPEIEHIFCDNDPFCQQVIRKHWPNARIYDDIKYLNGKEIKADIITGGFPCQPFSQAGKHQGTADNRHLWPEMLRVVREVKPRWIVGENVFGLLTWNDGMVFEQVLSDLENEGYRPLPPFVIPACAVEAPHRRDRVWIVAYSDSIRWSGLDEKQEKESSKLDSKVFSEWKYFENNLRMDFIRILTTQGSGVERNDDGLSEGMAQLKGYGNAIVPQVAIEIFKAIQTVETSTRK